MRPCSLLRSGLLPLIVVLQACAQAPAESLPAAPEHEPPGEERATAEVAVQQAPEIILNLPGGASCACEEAAPTDYTFLEKGFLSMARGDHREAMEYFNRYQRLESSPAADWEAGIAIAFLRSLGTSPFYDPFEARKRYRQLMKQGWQAMQLHEQTLLMRQSLENFRNMHRKLGSLEESNRTLQKDLEKREEAIKRLRELTLGQPAAAQ